MVDFNNESTITTAPKHVLDIIILQYYYEAIDSFATYRKKPDLQTHLIDIIRSRLYSLFYMLLGSIEESSAQFPKLKEYFRKLDTEEFDVLEDIFMELSRYLYSKGVLKFDTKRTYHPTNIPLRNKQMLGETL